MSTRQNIPYHIFDIDVRSELIQGQREWIRQHIDSGWEVYLFTSSFDEDGATTTDSIIQLMRQYVLGWYGRLIMRTMKNPKSCSSHIPKAIFVTGMSLDDEPSIHGVVAAKPYCEVKATLDDYFIETLDQYLIPRFGYVDVELITHENFRTIDREMKGHKPHVFSPDHILILPRSLRNRNRLPLRKALKKI